MNSVRIDHAHQTEGRVRVEYTSDTCLWHGVPLLRLFMPVRPDSNIIVGRRPVCVGCCVHAAIQKDAASKAYYVALLRERLPAAAVERLTATLDCTEPALAPDDRLYAAMLVRARLYGKSVPTMAGDLLQEQAYPGWLFARFDGAEDVAIAAYAPGPLV
jgi:hypothetical protein